MPLSRRSLFRIFSGALAAGGAAYGKTRSFVRRDSTAAASFGSQLWGAASLKMENSAIVTLTITRGFDTEPLAKVKIPPGRGYVLLDFPTLRLDQTGFTLESSEPFTAYAFVSYQT